MHTLFTRADVQRYLIACENDPNRCEVKLVESAAWRGIMFPVDGRLCQNEMQSAHFSSKDMQEEYSEHRVIEYSSLNQYLDY